MSATIGSKVVGPTTVSFDDVAVLPDARDNCAIAKLALPAGVVLQIPNSGDIVLRNTILEGHRFTISLVSKGCNLLSWALPFGIALEDIPRGSYVMNRTMQYALQGRALLAHEAYNTASTPSSGQPVSMWNPAPSCEDDNIVEELLRTSVVNFQDVDVSPESPFVIDDKLLSPKGYNSHRQVPWEPAGGDDGCFDGYHRPEINGVGTRNHVVIFALTAASTPFVRSVESHYRKLKLKPDSTCDGVRVVVHTEGESAEQNNRELLLRTLCGLLVHPNVGSSIVVTTGEEANISFSDVVDYAASHREHYAAARFSEPFCQALCLADAFNGSSPEANLREKVGKAVEIAERTSRSRQSLRHLRIALQCGGSDAFSGINGNPLAGDVAQEMLRNYGSSSNLAESPELVGAEYYILENVATKQVAHHFISTTERFKAFAASHGQSAAGNPSGGNLFRGLYNIVLKSLGAARKKPPGTSLDGVLEYGELMQPREEEIAPSRGGCYFFMDSPGNDLESIAGQVATGCNIIFFITGNGAMTNFPFVPTIKIVTTSARFSKLAREMDVDAGRYTAEGDASRAAQVEKTVELVRRVASGELSKGELAGHAQVSIWRNWSNMTREEAPEVSATPAAVHVGTDSSSLYRLRLECDPLAVNPATGGKAATDAPIGLSPFKIAAVIPTSICSGEIARAIVDQFNEESFLGLRWVAPVHTEGCGSAGDRYWEAAYQRLLLSFAVHESTAAALLLEHGCEKTHNDFFKLAMAQCGISDDCEHVGFCSVQKDGGIDAVKHCVREYFSQPPSSILRAMNRSRPVTLGLLVNAPGKKSTKPQLSSDAIGAVGEMIRQLSGRHKVNVVLPEDSPLLMSSQFIADTFVEPPSAQGQGTTLRFAQAYTQAQEERSTSRGVHIMEGLPPSLSWIEWVTGLSVACDMLVVLCGPGSFHVVATSLLVPTLRVVWPAHAAAGGSKDGSSDWSKWVESALLQVTSAFSQGEGGSPSPGNAALFTRCDFAIPRGHAVSM